MLVPDSIVAASHPQCDSAALQAVAKESFTPLHIILAGLPVILRIRESQEMSGVRTHLERKYRAWASPQVQQQKKPAEADEIFCSFALRLQLRLPIRCFFTVRIADQARLIPVPENSRKTQMHFAKILRAFH